MSGHINRAWQRLIGRIRAWITNSSQILLYNLYELNLLKMLESISGFVHMSIGKKYYQVICLFLPVLDDIIRQNTHMYVCDYIRLIDLDRDSSYPANSGQKDEGASSDEILI